MPFRRHALPDAIRRSVDLAPGDKILASAELTDGSWAVATRQRLSVLDTSGTTSLAHRWCDVDRATFDPQTAAVTILWVDDDTRLTLTLADPRRTALVQTIRERVQSSVVLAETVTLSEGRSVKVAVRRDGSGALFSQVVADAGVDLDDPAIRAKIDGAENRVRSASGLPL